MHCLHAMWLKKQTMKVSWLRISQTTCVIGTELNFAWECVSIKHFIIMHL